MANGYHGAAMDEIAETAHVSKPVLYQHFPSKRELYLALLDSHLSALTELLLGALNSTTDNDERVQAVMRAYFHFIASDDQAHRLVFESDLVNDPDVSARLETFNKTFADAIAKVIAEDTKLPLLEAQLLGRGTGRNGAGQCPVLAGNRREPGPRCGQRPDLPFSLARNLPLPQGVLDYK